MTWFKKRRLSIPEEQIKIFEDASIAQNAKNNRIVDDDGLKEFFPPYEVMEEKKRLEYNKLKAKGKSK